MTRKHFELIARRIREARDRYPDSHDVQSALDVLVYELSADFPYFNATFNKRRFVQACARTQRLDP